MSNVDTWQLRALADAADQEAEIADPHHVDTGYLRGVADAYRVLSGDADPRTVSESFAALYQRYLDSV